MLLEYHPALVLVPGNLAARIAAAVSLPPPLLAAVYVARRRGLLGRKEVQPRSRRVRAID